jgi:hypothetical protein
VAGRYARRYHGRGGGPTRTRSAADAEEIGHLLGKSRQSIAKLLRLSEQDNMVRLNYGRVFIERPDTLMQIAYPERSAPSAAQNPRQPVSIDRALEIRLDAAGRIKEWK